MPLMLRQVLENDALGLTVIAGASGIDGRGPINWIHTSELPDPSKWLRGGEILLTTGFGVRRAPKAQRRLIVNLDALGCVGIGLGIGDWLKSVPEVMIDEANRRGFPLFTVPYATPFSVVTRYVAQEIFAEQYARRRPGSTGGGTSLLAEAALGEDLPSIVEALAQRVPSSHVVVFDFFGTPLARHPVRIAGIDAIWRATVAHSRRDRISVRIDDRTLTGAVIRVDALVEGVLLVVTTRALRESELAVFEQSSVSVELALRRNASPRAQRRARFSALLRDVADAAYIEDALARKFAEWVIDARRGYAAIAVAPRDATGAEEVAGIVEDTLVAEGGIPLVGVLDGNVHAIVGRDPSVAMAVAQAVARVRGELLGVGVSRVYRHVRDARHALREAQIALAEAGDGVRQIGELGFSGLIPHLRSDDAALEATARVIEPLLEHDRRHGSMLMHTLATFVANAFRPGVSAARLGIHRHTLSYRLQQIAELTRRDLQNGEHLLELAFALRLHDSAMPMGSAARGDHSSPSSRRG